eukprot:4852514-Amphidinium_carterae.1
MVIGKYMEIKITFKQTLKNIIEDRREYKQTHFHDYSVITTNVHLNEEYAKKMITEIDQQSETKREPQPPWQHRFLMFLVQDEEDYEDSRRLYYIRSDTKGAYYTTHSTTLSTESKRTTTVHYVLH